MHDLNSRLPLILAGVGFLLVSMLAPFWTSIVAMVLVLFLVFYIMLSMLLVMLSNLFKFAVGIASSIVYDSYGGTHDGEDDTRRIP
jgi:hypothetical protein